MNTKNPVTFQAMILALQNYWAGQGCVIWTPYHTEVGAGTMNPGTVLRVLGPEPWWVAYLEPSVRPADGRYGENPNRWQHYYQFQVILKPDPGDPQERYLNSLIALGINPQEHDIRFVEDNWESPALGAWGLGWEVWLDGQEITQYTYFQQSGQRNLENVAVEITYGIERILLALQGVDNFLQIKWNDQLTYGDIHLQGEVEYSRYNFEEANVDRLRTLYDEYEAEARNCLEAGLVLPAHDYVLKCSHTFNLLDARGAIGVTERASLFGRMRDISRKVSDAFYEQREEAGFPWKGSWSFPLETGEPTPSGKMPDSPGPFLLEIGTEELPAGDLDLILAQLEQQGTALLDELRLTHGGVTVMGTPRRQVLYVEDLAPRQTESIELVKGPPASRAFDKDGKPTKAAMGFARSKGIQVDALRVESLEGGDYVVAEVRETGLPAAKVLAGALPQMLESLSVPRAMRWNESQVTYSRPIRWLLALHAEHVVPFEYAGLSSSNHTRLMRFDDPATISVADPAAFFEAMNARGILLDPERRKATIESQVEAIAATVGGRPLDDEDLLSEVTNLVEIPTPLIGEFDEAFLGLPHAVLISVMKKHQRYFPVLKGEALLPYFIALRNGGEEHLDVVRHGNEQVIKARFADARYFVQKDREKKLEEFLPRLKTLTFQEKLGSMYDKAIRMQALVGDLGTLLDLSSDEQAVATRAAQLAKADLASSMVVEMTSLQGEMGRVYALDDGEPQAVADAIGEHYLPRSAGDRLPSSKPGLALAVADRLDSLIGLFAAGIQPTGARDPFALRRTAMGLVQILLEKQLSFDLKQGLQAAAAHLPIDVSDETLEACMVFMIAREQGVLLGEGFAHDAVEAVLDEQGHNPAGAHQALIELETWRAREDWDEILQAYARCRRITRSETVDVGVDASLLQDPAEVALGEALREQAASSRPTGSVDAFMKALVTLVPPITTFFDDVLVMVDDPAIRANRLALLQEVVSLADGVVNLERVEGF